MVEKVRSIKKTIEKYARKHPLRMILWLGLLIIVIVPLGLQLVMWLLSFGMFNIGTDDGWLGFWGGYLGALIAIGGVYWSVNKQLISDKESTYRVSRPFFIVNLEKLKSLGELKKKASEVYVSKDVTDTKKANSAMCINNVSSKNMYAVKVIVEYEKSEKSLDDKEGQSGSQTDTQKKDLFKNMFKYFVDTQNSKLEFYKKNSKIPKKNPNVSEDEMENLKASYSNAISIDKIAADQKVILCFTNKNINKVWIWYTTEIRESIKLYFSKNTEKKHTDKQELIYRKEDHLLENQLEQKNPKRYDSNYILQDFNQSKTQ
ncbi:prophage Lp1 protein 35 [Lactiplantibacillus plantarum]|uniref:hypothetical protein n=1 Tax=Lactiplantibacillus plantarum TaxID=1590 RepID=UPI0007B55ABC|nr:hypothetical protein [Lactiplantibacillus plantarum]KZU26966.1 prophage Lp1 protein 35 [Lactiplantibacillus plantarum]KZU76442.1 prophage Lp1 protein 35 [Lactiplantibacillus plantarum]